MATNFKDYGAECPFYKTTSGRFIMCEGFVKKTNSAVVFENKAHLQEWFEHVCCQNYELCPTYRAIMKEKYKRGA